MKRWYVVQVFAGYEQIVKNDLLKRISEEDAQELFGEILIPSAQLAQMFGADQELKEQQLFPGYVLIEMDLAPKSMRMVESTNRVVRFLGGKDPVALSDREVKRIISQVKGEIAVASKKSEFVVGSEIEIQEGPFSGFVGIIDTINEEAKLLTVMVSIFGRMTPVEIRFEQVKQ